MGLLRLPKLGWMVTSTIATTIATLPLGGCPSWAEVIPQTRIAQASGAGIGQCQPPAKGEYLVFVLSRTPEAQAKVRGKVPSDTRTIVCSYQGAPVTRLGGFGSENAANAWAQYLNQTTGLEAVVVRPGQAVQAQPAMTPPPMTPVPTAQPTATVSAPSPSSNGTSGKTAATPTTGTYQPQQLGSGYAVLISYGKRPELANQLRQVLSKEVGLAVYAQRPYLLALQTSDLTAANSVLQLLNDRGFLGIVVEAKRVVLLKESVMVNP